MTGALGAADLGMTQALLEEVTINPTIEPPEVTRDWGNRLLEGTNRTSCAPGPRRKEQRPYKRLTRSALGYPSVSCGGVGQWWPVAGLGALSVAVRAWDLSKEVTIIFITSTIVSVQFSRSVMSDSLRPHESQNARPPCPSPTPGVHSDSRPLSR